MSIQPIPELKSESAIREISPARLAANKANAQKSTGPRTPEGKTRVSANALKHGLCSERNPSTSKGPSAEDEVRFARKSMDLAADAALPHEQTQFLETLEALKVDLAPVGQLETLLVERLAHLDLRLQRALRMETAHLNLNATLIVHELAATGSTIATDTGAIRDNGLSMMAFLRDPNALTLIGRYESRLGREFARTLTQFHQSQKLRKQTQITSMPMESLEPIGPLAGDSQERAPLCAIQEGRHARESVVKNDAEPQAHPNPVAQTSVCLEASASRNLAEQTQCPPQPADSASPFPTTAGTPTRNHVPPTTAM